MIMGGGRKIVILFAAAFLLRLMLMGVWYGTGQSGHMPDDAYGHYAIAESLLQGKGFQLEGKPTLRRPPVYPFLMALNIKWHFFPAGIYVSQIFAGTLICLIVYLLGKEIFNETAGFIAGILAAADYLAVRQTASVMPDLIFVFFLILSFYFAYRAWNERKDAWLFGAGLAGGAALLTKDVLILFYFLFPLWFLFWGDRFKKIIQRTALFFSALFLVIGPWIIRNVIIQKQPVLLTISAGHNFYFGNNPEVTGRTTGGEWELGKDFILKDDPDMPVLWSLEADRYFAGKAGHYIREKPGLFFKRMGRKVVKMWRPYLTESPGITQFLTAITYLPVMFFGILGTVLSLPRWKAFFPIYLLMAYVVIVHAATISAIRYRFPVMPFWALFAGFAILYCYQGLKKTEKVGSFA
ncbi:MAG TPA: glycosyltransferase family 39 protein [bacterium]|nr:glycosyltransferase family 39 protein [bacterium]